MPTTVRSGRGINVLGTRGTTHRAQEIVIQMIGAGQLRPKIDRVFSLRDAAEAHRHMESGTHIGRVILTA